MRQRRIARRLSRQRIADYADVMFERADTAPRRLDAGQNHDIGAEMMPALEVVARTLFNTDVTSDVDYKIKSRGQRVMELILPISLQRGGRLSICAAPA